MTKEVSITFAYPTTHAESYGDAFKQTFKQIYNINPLKLYTTLYNMLRLMTINGRIYETAKTSSWVKIEKIL